MEIKLCVPDSGDTCYSPAVGTGKRPIRHCRPHHLEAIADEIVRAQVTGDIPITDVRTGEAVGRGGVVELDPVETSITQLIYAGHVKVLPAPTAEAPPPAGTETDTAEVKPEAAAKPGRKAG